MRKRIISILLVVLFCALSFNTPTSNAESEKTNHNPVLYVATKEINKRIIDYAITQKDRVYESLPQVVGNWSKIRNKKSITYGRAFKINDIIYIPIISNNTIIALLEIVDEGSNEYSWILSIDFSEGLNRLSGITSKQNPAILYAAKRDIYAHVSGYDDVNLTGVSNCETNKFITDISNDEVVDILSPENRKLITYNDGTFRSSTVGTSRYLNIDFKEIQGDDSWCAAYVGACIMRYKCVNTYAKSILKWAYPGVNNNELRDRSISWRQLTGYAMEKGFKVVNADRTFSMKEVKGQIDAGLPLYLGTYNKKNTDNRHAFALRGYNTSTKTYSVWNPWCNYHSVMSSESKSIPARGGITFVWDKTIYNWYR